MRLVVSRRGHMKKIKVLSPFNGISCGRVALERAGIEVERYVSYEIDEKANFVAKKNYPQDEYNGDVFKADFTQYKGFDLLIGGSPCTYWSIAKSRWGNRETTSEGMGFELFRQYVRALEESGCRYFLYENNNSISDEIKEEISKALGVQPITIDSALVSAQNRKRCYWTNISGVKQPKDRMIEIQDILESGIAYQKKAYCLTTSYGGAVLWNSLERSQRTMVAELDAGGEEVKGRKIRLTHKNREKEEITKEYKINLADGYYSFRKMTPVEIERLQTLPDNFTEGIDTQARYKAVGNGWTVDIIAHILNYLKSA